LKALRSNAFKIILGSGLSAKRGRISFAPQKQKASIDCTDQTTQKNKRCKATLVLLVLPIPLNTAR
jgi:hypothetical protein